VGKGVGCWAARPGADDDEEWAKGLVASNVDGKVRMVRGSGQRDWLQ